MRRFFVIIWLGLLVACSSSQTIAQPTAIPPTATFAPTATPAATATPIAGTTRRDQFGVEQVWVTAGTFTMGSTGTPAEEIPRWGKLDNEQPAHQVTISNGFWLDAYEVTHEAYQRFVDDGGYTKNELWDEAGLKWLARQNVKNLPVKCTKLEANFPQACLTWYEASAYAKWRGGRLPTEAEWEYAARGIDQRVFPWGNEFDPKKANLTDSKGLVAVGTYPDGKSWVGAFDMTGNVMEWVQDWYDKDYYKQGDMTDPQGPATGTIKVKKGGWWGAPPFAGRTTFRHEEDQPTYQDHHIGVRVVTP